jgi:anhydro-N-acetylmuramic acid kinase
MNTSFYSLGLMSGSSLDGLDICYSRIDVENNHYSFEIIAAETIEYSIDLYTKLKHCRDLSETELKLFDIKLGLYFGKQCLEFISCHSISQLDFISSHGHTVYHYPERGITLQIGNGLEISKHTKIKTLTNLRQVDIDHGGSGAPIVPIGDLLLFQNYKYCLNLGGIMNISIKENDSIIAYDIGACNQVINHYANQKRLDYDKDGELARKGKFDTELFDQLNNLDYFKLKYPKSLDNGFSNSIIEILNEKELSIEDKLNTFYHHLAYQISNTIDKNDVKSKKILATGGGAKNIYLIELIRENYNLNIHTPEFKIIDFKEALVMSLIGVRFFENKYNVLASVTGARQNTICGELFNL